MKIKPLTIKARYYETDKMGIIHHSNYIRWFEEARVYALEQIGLPFDKLEDMGIASPVLTVNCKYKHPVHFNEEVDIFVKFISFSGVRLEVEYEVRRHIGGELCTMGISSHGFIGTDGKPCRIKKEFPQVYKILMDSLEEK